MGDTIERKIVKVDREPKEELVRVWDYTIPKNEPINKQKNISDIEVNLGDKVKHKKWGIGTIVRIEPQEDDKELTIAFDNKGLKRLLMSIAPIEFI